MKIGLFNPLSFFKKRPDAGPVDAPEPVLDPRCTCTHLKKDSSRYLISGIGKAAPRADLLTTIHNNACPLDHSREATKIGRARWHVNNTQQTYKPLPGSKLNPGVEVYYRQLGLDDQAETQIGESHN